MKATTTDSRLKLEIGEAMEREGISRSELARRLGVTRQSVTQFFNADCSTEVQTLQIYAEAIGYRLEIRIVKNKE